jgi:nucleotide sugar dehydrogenase
LLRNFGGLGEKVKIQVIGLGVVGQAQAYLMKKLGFEVCGYDVNPVSSPYLRGVEITETYAKDVDLTFICSPEKTVPGILRNLVQEKVPNHYVIKSTVPTGTTSRLMREFGVHISHNPEFLREKTSVEDVVNQSFVIVGQCCPDHGDLLSEVYASMGARIIRTRPEVSEMSKLTINNYLATLITFWNEIDKVCARFNLDTKDVANLVRNDPRISEYGTSFFGQPFGGKCLPKDLNQTLALCNSLGIRLKLFETMKTVNDELPGPVPCEMK